jgi:pimeloyl-ACP methyl ester carboxylesterase/DNA-binding CsgD family transcriptional regulator
MEAKTAAAQVLSGLYQAIADHTQVDMVLRAMDDFIDANPDGLERGEADWRAMFRDHFGRVSQFIDYAAADPRESPIVHVDKQVVPAAVINRQYDIIASNSLFDQMIDLKGRSLSELFTTPTDKRRLEALLRTNSDASPILVSLTVPDHTSPIFVVAMKSHLLDVSDRPGPFVTLKVSKATWNPDIVPLLESAYSLTPAEIEVLESLVESGSISEVATARGRSIRTVRTQLSNIFGKLGLSGQTELALFLATLAQLMTKKRRPSDVGKDWFVASAKTIERGQATIVGGSVAYVKYGDPKGTPVLMIHSTTPPDMPPDFRRACDLAGLRIMAVHKPGSGGYQGRDSRSGPKDLAADYAAILDAEKVDEAIIAGHCSGGLYALQFAKTYPNRCRGVVLIDTGLPFTGRKELMALPKGLRRTFLSARYMPEVLLVPHRIFAANFKRSAEGEAAVVDYFFEDDPIDQMLTRTNRQYYEITRRIIGYSFEDVTRLVADVTRWARDWSELLRVIETHHIHFIHGNTNNLFAADKIVDWVSTQNNASAEIAKGKGQLQLYQDPDIFTRSISAVLGRRRTLSE